MNEKNNIFEEAERKQSLYQKEIEALRNKWGMPHEKEPEKPTESVWEEICHSGHSWVVGVPLVGVLVGVDEDSKYSKIYNVEVKPGEIIEVYGTAVLESKLKRVSVGSMIRITYLGEAKSEKGRIYKDFKVEVKK